MISLLNGEPMSEKLTESITHKCTYEEREFLEALAKAEGKTLSELVRENNKARISAEKERLNLLNKVLRLTTDTVVTPILELTSEPMPKPQAQKKPNCCDQMSIFAVHSES